MSDPAPRHLVRRVVPLEGGERNTSDLGRFPTIGERLFFPEAALETMPMSARLAKDEGE